MRKANALRKEYGGDEVRLTCPRLHSLAVAPDAETRGLARFFVRKYVLPLADLRAYLWGRVWGRVARP